ncbi:ogr/Delta-like zinc finger family protein [Proteus sp. PR00174]|nr:ogr/Delta-like zinc finger family protein [Proteus sp. PR00174]MBJ2108483.1 ogr/Delta-like zinc finger family protein [Proteus terrae]MBJ2131278.1 ogr/Delta-like zinc finger family protein [Proteus terrae]
MLPVLPIKIARDVFNWLFSGGHKNRVRRNKVKLIKVLCPACSAKAKIHYIKMKGENNDPELYCACNDLECGMTFVLDVTFSHTLNPSKLTQSHPSIEQGENSHVI